MNALDKVILNYIESEEGQLLLSNKAYESFTMKLSEKIMENFKLKERNWRTST